MVIHNNLPPANPNSGSGPAPAPTLPTLAKELGIQVHQVIQAQVVRITAVTDSEREALLATRVPSGQARANPLTEILKSPDLRLAHLAVDNRVFHALTNLPLLPRQSVNVLLDRFGNLQLMPAVSTLPNPLLQSVSSIRKASNPGDAGPLQLKMLQPLLRQQSQQALASAMRQVLPHAEPLHRLLNAVKPWLEQHPGSSVEGSAPRPGGELKASLRLLAGNAPALANLTKEGLTDLKIALRDSGIGLERHLAQTAAGAPPERDTKLLLIKVLHALAGLGFSNRVASLASPAMTGRNQDLEAVLEPVWTARNTTAADSDGATRQQLQRLVSLAEAALSQVQSNQYRSISAQTAEGAPAANFFTDIPLRLADGFVTVFFQFQEIRDPEKKRKRGDKSEKPRSRWVVFMELTIEDQGQLAVEVSVVDKHVDAQFWSSHADLREDARRGMQQLRQQLENQGLTVTDLRCSPAPIPQKNVRLDYSLIDVKT